MLGAIIGDIVGSIFEWNNNRSKEFTFLSSDCFFTDDSVMTLAIAQAILNCHDNFNNLSKAAIKEMQRLGQIYQNCGYGNKFYLWLFADNPQPYNSWGNGSAMRISSIAYVANSIDEVKNLSLKVTEITHNHPEGIKGAEATAVAIFLARTGVKKEDIKKYIVDNYYDIDFTLDEIRPKYMFDESCQGTVPQALEAFFESNGFEDAIRNAISIGGDSDTLAAITGGIAEAYYGIPNNIKDEAIKYLDKELKDILLAFYNKYVH